MVITFDCDPSILAIIGSDGEWSGKQCVNDLTYSLDGAISSSLTVIRNLPLSSGAYSLVGKSLHFNETLFSSPGLFFENGTIADWGIKRCASADLIYSEIGMESSLIFSQTIFSEIGICSLTGNTANVVLDKNLHSEIVVYSLNGDEAILDVFIPYRPEECDGLLSDVMTYKSVLNDNVENNMEMAIADQDFDYVCG